MEADRADAVADVVVLGAGLAGATAAALLAERGLSVAILEARDRVGGRALARAFCHGGPQLEFGGAWIAPGHRRVREWVERCGLRLVPRQPLCERRWYYEGGLHSQGPTSADDRAAHDRVMARIAADAFLVRMGREHDEYARPLADISFADYCGRLRLPPATREYLSAWWCVTSSGDWNRVPATSFLEECGATEGTPEGVLDSWASTVSPSVDVLAERMIERSGAQLRLNCEVAALTQSRDGVEVRTRDGQRFGASACVVALGINACGELLFEPALPPRQAEALTRGHEGKAFKLWVELRGVEPGVLATGGGKGIELMFSEHPTSDGTTLVVGFGLAQSAPDLDDERAVAREVSRFFPEAEFVAYDWHDWVSDPYALGTWVGRPLAGEAGLDPANWDPFERVAFATSDIAPDEAGWFEGAIASAERAVDAIGDILKPSQVA